MIPSSLQQIIWVWGQERSKKLKVATLVSSLWHNRGGMAPVFSDGEGVNSHQ